MKNYLSVWISNEDQKVLHMVGNTGRQVIPFATEVAAEEAFNAVLRVVQVKMGDVSERGLNGTRQEE